LTQTHDIPVFAEVIATPVPISLGGLEIPVISGHFQREFSKDGRTIYETLPHLKWNMFPSCFHFHRDSSKFPFIKIVLWNFDGSRVFGSMASFTFS